MRPGAVGGAVPADEGSAVGFRARTPAQTNSRGLTVDWLHDERTGCWSVQTTMTVNEYIDLVRAAHEAQGALTGQRDVLTTTTAKRIRARMIADIKMGAVLPPVVIGAVVSEARHAAFPGPAAESIADLLDDSDPRDLSIIDGMQRTAALMEAAKEHTQVGARPLRVEFWLASSVRAMIYRMLVLNTGQVPWTMSRQLSVVYGPLLKEIRANVPEIDKMPSPEAPGRRVGPAQYSSEAVVELYIAFSLRKTAVDTREAVSDEFSRLDFVDNLAEAEFQGQFYGALALLTRLDKAFSRYDGEPSGRMARGRHVFDAQPARIGFIVAIGIAILGRPGANRAPEERIATLAELESAEATLLKRLEVMTQEELADFLRLDVLREVLDRRVGQVGRYERSVYFEAFKVLVEERFALDNLEQCWRAN